MVSTGPQFTTPDAYLRTIYEQFEKNLDNSNKSTKIWLQNDKKLAYFALISELQPL